MENAATEGEGAMGAVCGYDCRAVAILTLRVDADRQRAGWDGWCIARATAYTERTDAISPRFIRVPGSSHHCGSRGAVAHIAQ